MNNSMYSGLTDEQLIGESLNGNSTCVGILYSRYYSKVYSRCISFTRNNEDAFDMTQDILLKAICNAGSFEGKSKFSTWLYSITNNYCISQTAKRCKNHYEDINTAQHIAEEATDNEEFEERVRWESIESNLDELLMSLPEDERRMLQLRYHKNYSVKELQGEFDLSASAIKMRLLRARSKMGQILGIRDAA